MDAVCAPSEALVGITDNHAAERWAAAVASLRMSARDARTIADWGRAIGVSAGALREWCQVARVSPRRTLLLARLLRAVTHSTDRPWRPEQRLDIVDRRTLRRLLLAGGLPFEADRVTVSDLLTRQTLVTDSYALLALRKAVLSDVQAPRHTCVECGRLRGPAVRSVPGD
jgi:hypothetical protein